MLEIIQEEIKYNHVPYLNRFFMFVLRKKLRFTVVGVLACSFTLWGNVIIFTSSKLERTFKRYKKDFILKTSPWCMGWQSALDTQWEPSQLSRRSTDKLGELFVKADRELNGGVSRQLIADVLASVSE